MFPEVPSMGFKKGKSLKDILVKLEKKHRRDSLNKECGGKRCQVCKIF